MAFSTTQYLVHNSELLSAEAKWLHPDFAKILPELVSLRHELLDGLEQHELPYVVQDALRALGRAGAQYTQGHTGAVLRFPFLHPDMCNALLEEVQHWKFSPNPDEDKAYQMQEAVLSEVCPVLFRALKELHECALNPVWASVYGVEPEQYSSIQLAKYHPGENGMTNWHFDQDSQLTTTVVLSPDDAYEGGGMQVFPGLDLGRASQGWASMFFGATTLHRSNPVTQGERALLVYWTNVENRDE